MSGRCCQGQTPSRDIPGPGKCLALPDGAPLPPGDYSTTPGGTVFGTTPGGERRAGPGERGGLTGGREPEGLGWSKGLQGTGSAPVLTREEHREPPPCPGARGGFGAAGAAPARVSVLGHTAAPREPRREQPRPPNGY